MTAGRPTKYDPAYCEQVIAAGDENLSLTAFAGLIGVARSTINEWMGEHPEFEAAVAVHKAKRTLCLERAGNTIIREGGGQGSSTLVIFGLKNVDPDEWRDRREVEHSGTISHEHALAELE